MKNYRVSKNKIQSADVITTCLHIMLSQIAHLQCQPKFKPNLWGNLLSITQKQVLMEKILTDSVIIFRRCKYNYINHMIDVYKSEDDKIKGRIDTLIRLQLRCCTKEVGFELKSDLLTADSWTEIL